MVTPIVNPCEVVTPTPCGVNPAFTYTRFPCDFDDPRPTDSRGLPVIVDLQTPVKAEVVNRHRESILAVENELGIQPSGTYTTVRDRLDALEAYLCGLWVSVGNIASATPVQETIPVTSDGQTVFTTSKIPATGSLILFIGGIKQELSDYTVVGNVITWNGAVTLITDDIVEVLYFLTSGGGEGVLSALSHGVLVEKNVISINFTGDCIAESDGFGNVTVITSGTGVRRQDVFTATVGQVNFTTTYTPTDQQSTDLFIDGISQTVGVDYTVSGNTVTYGNNPPLTGGETVVVKYQ